MGVTEGQNLSFSCRFKNLWKSPSLEAFTWSQGLEAVTPQKRTEG